MGRLTVVLLPLLIFPLISLSLLAWYLAGQATDQILVTQQQAHAKLGREIERRFQAQLESVAGAFTSWAKQIRSGKLSTRPPDGEQRWSLVLDDEGRWWHPPIYAAHFFLDSSEAHRTASHVEELSAALEEERINGATALAIERYEGLDRDPVSSQIRAAALMALARCFRNTGRVDEAWAIYSRMVTEFDETLDESGMNFGAEASRERVLLRARQSDSPAGRAAWRDHIDALLEERFAMPWALALGQYASALAWSPEQGVDGEDARRQERLEARMNQLEEMHRASSAISERFPNMRATLRLWGDLALLTIPIDSTPGHTWVVVAYDRDWIKSRLVAPVLSAVQLPGNCAVVAEDEMGEIFVGHALAPQATTATVDLNRWGLPWTVGIGFADYGAMRSETRARHVLLSGSVIVLLALMVVGILLGQRMIRRELELSKLKSDFVDNVSHELRTPVTSIKMFSEMLLSGQVTDPSKRLEYFRLLAAESNRLGRMLDNMLNFSRIVAGTVKLHFESTDMAAYLSQLHQQLEIQARPSGHRVRLHLADHLPSCRIDRDSMARTLANLVSNAIKYSPEEPEIIITAQRRDDLFSITVRDHGLGVPAQDLPHIFDRFYRAEHSNGGHIQGTGLGLTIAKDAVERHGGTIRVDSGPNRGTVVELSFPIEQEGDS